MGGEERRRAARARESGTDVWAPRGGGSRARGVGRDGTGPTDPRARPRASGGIPRARDPGGAPGAARANGRAEVARAEV